MILTEPLRLTETAEAYDIDATSTVAASPVRPAPCATASPGRSSSSTPSCAPSSRGRLPDPRRSQEGIQEVRPQEGPQGSAVLQALSPGSSVARTRPHPGARRAPPLGVGARRVVVVPRAASGRALRRSVAMTLRFGTDGVRGAGRHELTAELALALGRAAAQVLGGGRVRHRSRHPALRPAARGGARRRPGRRGAEARSTSGWCPPRRWPGWRRDGVPGAVISASHNPFGDNGIKFFAAGRPQARRRGRGRARGAPRADSMPRAPGSSGARRRRRSARSQRRRRRRPARRHHSWRRRSRVAVSTGCRW